MKANILSVTIVAASMVMVSCNNDDATVLNNDGIVRFTSGITAAPASRAVIDTKGNSLWEANDPVGIYMVANGTTNVVEGNANMKYTAEQGGASTAFTAVGASIYYPLNEDAAVDFIAYHPYRATIADFVYPVDLSTQTPQTAIDLMTAKADKGGAGYTKEDGRINTVVNFEFSHRLVKLVMNVTKDESVPGKITSVSINGMNTTANFDLTGVAGLTGAGTPAAITPCTVTAEEKYEAILLPLGSLTDAHTVKFTTDNNEDYFWTMKKQIPSFEAGKIYTYEVTVAKHAVTANGSINGWEVGSEGSGIAD